MSNCAIFSIACSSSPLSYGGSRKMMSNLPLCVPSAASESPQTTCAFSSRWHSARFSRTSLTASARLSTKSALFAPRESASMPSCPVPAKRSSTRASSTSNWIQLKILSLTLSVVGRVSMPLSSPSRRPRAEPVMTLMFIPPQRPKEGAMNSLVSIIREVPFIFNRVLDIFPHFTQNIFSCYSAPLRI